MSDNSTSSRLGTPALALGYAGLLPQGIALALALNGGEWGFVAIAGGFGYAALIFSFLGGVWWGQALAADQVSAEPFLFAVAPSLIALALFLPWTFGWEWPGPQLIILGLLIGLSPIVDRILGFADRAFMRLRLHLSVGLGALTIALGLAARQMV
ncbi:DUF3429 domain-containing protein [Altererythrobacter lutimaris]|uniref:DUF3429 domain-containing protein n=1 Tax=Altererythrobacter lutimaris TaxID=2743979 RepID=A0A850H9L1_9SPHN|nr:DUF3429 domain-containing protein [Altererythrobacter lutimaris]NVE93631.1 DUF3429 domain-containing protein [Altererythrobacter lutimaris]